MPGFVVTGEFPEGAESPRDGWVPEARTVRWYAGVMHEDRIRSTLRAEVEDRGADLAPGSDEYWALVAEVAVEHISMDMHQLAVEFGTMFEPPLANDPAANEGTG